MLLKTLVVVSVAMSLAGCASSPNYALSKPEKDFREPVRELKFQQVESLANDKEFHPAEWWEEKYAQNRASDVVLRRTIMICRGC